MTSATCRRRTTCLRGVVVGSVVGSASIWLGCNAVLGLDDRPHELAIVVDSGADVAIVESGPDVTAMDVIANDVTNDLGIDAAIALPCSPACTGAQKCLATWTPSTETYQYACIDPGSPSTRAGSCVSTDLGKTYFCSEGFACGYLYPRTTDCFPLCEIGKPIVCPSTAPFCDYVVDEKEGVGRCGQCNPAGADLTKATACKSPSGCVVRSNALAPECMDKPGVGKQGATCVGAGDCAIGFVCTCPSGLGDQCKIADAGTGICRQLCGPASPCTSGLSCGQLMSTVYHACK